MSSRSAASQATYELPTSTNVGQLARRGALWSMSLVFGRQLVSMIVTAVLARVLSPDDFGLVGMVATLTALVALFSDLGLSTATVQRKDLSDQQVHNLFWTNSVAGFLLWGICIALSPIIARFYGRPELVAISIALGSVFALSGFAVQPYALLQRQMRFKRMTFVEICSAAIGGVAATVLALSGFGYWALVLQPLISQSIRVVLIFLSSEYRPGRPALDAGTRSMLHFGGLLALNGAIVYFARNLDNILIGRMWGATDLAFYSRAYFLMMLPSLLVTGAVASVMVPALSALQDDKQRLGGAYRQALQLSALLACPMAAGLGLIAPEIVRLVYGPQWAPVAPILAWLSVSAVFQPIANTQGWLFTATGRGWSFLIASTFYALVTAAAFIVGVQDGAIGVARAYAIVFVVLVTFPVLYLAHSAAGIDLYRSVRTLLPVGIATLCMVIAVILVGWAFKNTSFNWSVVMAVKILSGAVVYCSVSVLLLRETASHLLSPFLPKSLGHVFAARGLR